MHGRCPNPGCALADAVATAQHLRSRAMLQELKQERKSIESRVLGVGQYLQQRQQKACCIPNPRPNPNPNPTPNPDPNLNLDRNLIVSVVSCMRTRHAPIG